MRDLVRRVNIRSPFLLLAVGVTLLVAIGAGKLWWDHRHARLEEAFRLLTVGMERMDTADAAGAERQFRQSIDLFQALGRDPLLALHHAFAAALDRMRRVFGSCKRSLFPVCAQDETLLALALSQDSTLLALATKHRLLCLLIASQRWTESDLPQPIQSAGALHVDSATAKAHVAVGDDGRVLTADCREPAPRSSPPRASPPTSVPLPGSTRMNSWRGSRPPSRQARK